MSRTFALPLALILLAGPAVAQEPLPAARERAQDASIPDIVERVTPAVVSLFCRRETGDARAPFGPRAAASMGSGVIIRSDGLIVTNNHVVDGAVDLRAVLHDGRRLRAEVVGTDPHTDLALLRVDAEDLPYLPFGNSSRIRVGETVLAVGNPLGIGQTVSKGIVSAKGRANVGIVEYEDFLQTDAAINPGNSGGALVDLRGELVGINTAIASRSGGFQGIGFAIPSEMARKVVGFLLRDGRVDRGQLGVLVQDLTPDVAEAIDGAPRRGVLVADVSPRSPAERAGLRRGDIVLSVDETPVGGSAQLRNHVALRGAGAEVSMRVWRDGRTRDVSVRLQRLGGGEDERER